MSLHQDMIRVVSLSGKVTAVPYIPDMPIYQYLREVLTPALNCHTRDGGDSVMENFIYNRPDKIQVVFDQTNRLERLGDVIPPDAKLHHTILASSNKLRGNATKGDITAECPICMQTSTDYEIRTCAHRFHAECMVKYTQLKPADEPITCPFCRTAMSDQDEWDAWDIVGRKASTASI